MDSAVLVNSLCVVTSYKEPIFIYIYIYILYVFEVAFYIEKLFSFIFIATLCIGIYFLFTFVALSFMVKHLFLKFLGTYYMQTLGAAVPFVN